MKNVSTLKPQGKIDSPKTPGGISKSLLTPCRRVGLSRNWRKNGPSPFISPLAGGSAEVKVEKSESKKRKARDYDKESPSESCLTPITSLDVDSNVVNINESLPNITEIVTTPSRTVSTPKRKKSKTPLSARIVDKDNLETDLPIPENINVDVTSSIEHIKESKEDVKDVITPVPTKSKSKVRYKPAVTENQCVEVKENINVNENNVPKPTSNITTKQKSPENLTKECIVVIQKKIFKQGGKSIEKYAIKDKKTNPVSQVLFDSDSDDVPLKALNKEEKLDNSKPNVLKKDEKNNPSCTPALLDDDDDDDFDQTCKVKVKKLDKTTSISGLKTDSSNKKKFKEMKLSTKPKIETKVCIESRPPSQSSLEDDDFVIDNRKTILIRKTYDKVYNLSKAKSTGSITQKDIDDLKARIEMKKKILLAKAVSEDTEELRELIKKWQKGCQDALMELMELMKSKFPDKQNMDYAEILQNLKIPSSLVGYDEDNDCFSTPTDVSIILSKFTS